MPPARRSTTRGTSRPGAATRPRALSRLEKSIDAAEAALRDLRTELGRGGRDLVKDLDKTLRDSRKNLRSLSRTVASDVAKLQKAATSRPTTSRRRRTTARKTR
jgi:predicted  nucleic acid-binding Zn-ribbon protein